MLKNLCTDRWYVIFRLLTDNPDRTVVYIKEDTKSVYIIMSQRIMYQKLETFDFGGLDQIYLDHRLGENAVCVSDSFVPPLLGFSTLVLSSPGILSNKAQRNTLKSYCRGIYMPMPTEDEVLRMRERVFPELSESYVVKLMALWGPIPRHTLVQINRDAQYDLLDDAESVDMDELARLARGTSTGYVNDYPHRLVHQRAAGQDANPGSIAADPTNPSFYRRGMCVISSDPFLLYISERLRAEQKWTAAFFVDTAAGIGALGALRGILFQDIALRALAEGGDFKIRKISNKGEADLNLPTTEIQRWASASELSSLKKCEKLLVASKSNEAGLDALLWDSKDGHYVPVDCTIAAKHDINCARLTIILNQLGWSSTSGWPKINPASSVDIECKYFWILPELLYHASGDRSPARLKGVASASANATFTHISEYVLCIPPSDTVSQVAKVCKERGVRSPSASLSDMFPSPPSFAEDILE